MNKFHVELYADVLRCVLATEMDDAKIDATNLAFSHLFAYECMGSFGYSRCRAVGAFLASQVAELGKLH